MPQRINYWLVDTSGSMDKEGFDSYAQALWGLNERAAQQSTATPIVNGQFSYYDPVDNSWYIVEIVPEDENDS